MKKVNKCPKCLSINVKWMNPMSGPTWECFDCGYEGTIIIEEEEEC